MGCEGCAKAILIAFNIVFFLVGAACLAVGIWVAIDGKIFFELLSNIPEDTTVYGNLIADAAYILIAAGAVIFVISFLGCCGAWKKNKCLLMTYAIIISTLILLEIACVVVTYFFYDKIVGIITDALVTALSKTYNASFTAKDATSFKYTSDNILDKGIDALQVKFQCCGINNSTDYNGKAPPTCCNTTAASDNLKTLVDNFWGGSAEFTVTDATCPTDESKMNGGCLESIKQWVLDKAVIFMAIGGATVGVELLLIIFSCCVICAIRDDENKA